MPKKEQEMMEEFYKKQSISALNPKNNKRLITKTAVQPMALEGETTKKKSRPKTASHNQ